MTETLYLDPSNYGAWSQYRKNCVSEEQVESTYCKHLYESLFQEKKENKTHIDLRKQAAKSNIDLKKPL
jgi:hypothetical protein